MSATKDKLIDRMNEDHELYGVLLLQEAYDYVVKINPPNVELINKLSKYLEDVV